MRSSIRLIATDLDGTLLGKGSALLPENTAALRRAANSGILIAIVSGRLPAVCSRLARDMGLDACHIIGLNGTQIWDAPFGRETYRSAFSPEVAAACWHVFDRERVPVTLYTPGGVHTNQRFDTPERDARYRANFAGAGVTVEIGADAVARGLSASALKFLVKLPEGAAQEAAVRAGLRGIEGIALTSSKEGTLEVMQAGIDKAWGLARLAGSLGIDAAGVMAFGDYDNDLAMLAWAGAGIAMGNASPQAKRTAGRVTATNEEAGVALAINAYLDGDLAL